MTNKEETYYLGHVPVSAMFLRWMLNEYSYKEKLPTSERWKLRYLTAPRRGPRIAQKIIPLPPQPSKEYEALKPVDSILPPA